MMSADCQGQTQGQGSAQGNKEGIKIIMAGLDYLVFNLMLSVYLRAFTGRKLIQSMAKSSKNVSQCLNLCTSLPSLQNI